MNVFNYNLIFKDEPALNKKHRQKQVDLSLEKILVIQSHALDDAYSVTNRSDWLNMHGQKIQYTSFSSQNNSFSWSLEIEDTLFLFWESTQRNIYYIKRVNYTPDKLCYWVLHTFFPLVLEVEKSYPILHVSSVEVNEKVVLFMACSNGGKSTLASYFIKQGHRLFSDDILAVYKDATDYYAIASYPFQRPFRKPESLGWYVENFATKPKPIHALYVLEKSSVNAEVQTVKLCGIEKFKALHKSIFFHFSDMKEEHFFFFTQMAQNIPVYKIIMPSDIQRLGDVYDVIVSM